MATENAMLYYGGVPQAIVPDNLKSAVTQSSKYEPLLNETFEDFALHYGTNNSSHKKLQAKGQSSC